MSAPPTVQEGGSIQFTVEGDVKRLQLLVPGIGSVHIPVHRGRAEYRLPPQVPGGSTIIVNDAVYPHPTGMFIEVVGGQSR